MVKDFLKSVLALVQDPHQSWGCHERRSSVRLRCAYKCLLGVSDSRVSATFTDLGEEGLGLQTTEPIKTGQRITIFCPFVDLEGTCGPVQAQVRWARPGSEKNSWLCGVHYLADAQNLADSWVSSVLKLLEFPRQSLRCQRRWVRADCRLEGTVGDPAQHVHVHNLGVGGALLKCDLTLQAGPTRFTVEPPAKLAALDLPGTLLELRGGNSGFYGLEFQPLDPSQLKLVGAYVKTLLRNPPRPD